MTGGAIHLDGPTDEGSSHSQSSSWTPVAVLLDSAFNRNAVVPVSWSQHEQHVEGKMVCLIGWFPELGELWLW